MHRKIRSENEQQNLALLIFGGARDIANGFDELLSEDTWMDMLSSMPTYAGEARGDTLLRISTAVLRVVLRVSCDFHRRVIQRLDDFPFKLLWLAWSPPDVECERRLEVWYSMPCTMHHYIPR